MSDAEGWQIPTGFPALLSGEIHVWRSLLIADSLAVWFYADLLSDDEQERAQRFRDSIHRQRFILARGLLRTLLGRYLETDPAQIVFAYSSYGKPRLAVPAADGLQFNLSHSHELALVAVGRDRPIGVDVEHCRPVANLDSLAARFLTGREYRAIAPLPPDAKHAAFFCGWTRKEAVLKAIGRGLADLSRVEVTMLPTEAPACGVACGVGQVSSHPDSELDHEDTEPHHQNPDMRAIADWWLSDLAIDRGYVAAVAAQWSAPMPPVLKMFSITP